MKEPYVEGAAIHDGPESCGVTREGGGEALTGALASWVWSREMLKLRGADAVEKSGRPHGAHRHGEVRAGPARSEAPGVSGNHRRGNREISGPPGGRASGPQREGFGRTPLTNGPKKSDPLIAPCVRRVVACLGPGNEGARVSGRGTIRTSIQGPHRRAAVAARERGDRRCLPRGGCQCWDARALAGAGPGRTGRVGRHAALDAGGAPRGGDHHRGDGRGGPQRLVPRAGPVPGRARGLEARRDRRPGRAAGGERRRGPAGPAPGQGARARAAPQGQGAGRDGRLAGAGKKARGGLPRRRGRMTRLEDRQTLVAEIASACAAGARLAPACGLAGIDLRTFQRWRADDGQIRADRRPEAARLRPAHALSEAERARIVALANAPRFASTPPARIVPALADEGVYVASEASFHRVLRDHGQMRRRGRARPPRSAGPPSTHVATAPGQVWCWDVTFLRARVQGRWFYLYVILDLWSRKIVGWEGAT